MFYNSSFYVRFTVCEYFVLFRFLYTKIEFYHSPKAVWVVILPIKLMLKLYTQTPASSKWRICLDSYHCVMNVKRSMGINFLVSRIAGRLLRPEPRLALPRQHHTHSWRCWVEPSRWVSFRRIDTSLCQLMGRKESHNRITNSIFLSLFFQNKTLTGVGMEPFIEFQSEVSSAKQHNNIRWVCFWGIPTLNCTCS